MHMADALVSNIVAGTMYVATATITMNSVKKLKVELNPKKIPVMGVMGAFVFAAQMINFTIPGTGSSGHLCGGILLTALLGPQASFLTLAVVLLIQCLLFADGGLLALGCNIWNIAFYSCILSYFLIWMPIMKNGVSRKKITLASILGCIISLQLGALSVTLQTTASGVTELPLGAFISMMQPIHLAIGVVEGLITSAVLVFIYNARPEILYGIIESKQYNKYSLRKTMIILIIITIITGLGLSLLASPYPDGLEWSIEKITGKSELEGKETIIHNIAETIQSKTSLLPDYSFKGIESEFGTSFSGVFGATIVLFICGGICYFFTIRKRR